MYFVKYQMLLHIVGVIYIQSVIKLISSLLVVPGSTPPSLADEKPSSICGGWIYVFFHT